uniref:Uncharacterized protein n=1 Tax=Helminthora furcellata TaxID=1884666 RepID=A0A1G4NR38_9FLOR|nr:Hypothetical protein ORF_5 [Helminthora furcellata]SCW21130.1 Hypothetical protein ORF_5 [Helminthora furcellata]SCW23990.1 Hypothetical protein ORF_5 [Helminthora furcellata]
MIICNQYINSPRYWLRQISNRYKLILITVYITVVPFCPVYILLLMHIILILLWTFVFKDYPALYKNWLFTLLFIYSLYFILALFTSSTVTINLCIPLSFKIYTNFIINWNSAIGNKLYINCQSYNIHLYLPFLLTRSYILIVNYFSIYNFIILTTSTEQLILNLIGLMTNKKFKISYSADSIFIVMLSSEVINLLTHKLSNTKTSITLRGLTSLQTLRSSYYLVYLVFEQYQKIYIEILYHLLYTIYSRELLFYRLDLWLIMH